jgi:hypothetical protein
VLRKLDRAGRPMRQIEYAILIVKNHKLVASASLVALNVISVLVTFLWLNESG